MEKIKDIITTTYKYDDKYLIDVVENKEEEFFEAWLYGKENTQKLAILTVPTTNIEFKDMVLTDSAFLALVDSSIHNEHLIEMYEEVCGEE
ncbi:hypothetical protein [Lachnobacterium bovis]|uniref:Uncharacterized protein n=1 Tax=Lachnobacterium bovis TaxID=140626 RepID=A0A1H9S3M8_9FIRM|nr:hypothetical protein [Lachnobacterium bovis]SER79666.1 hypothetical protein SAMN02910429_01126 [Lachnobacterium bovis]